MASVEEYHRHAEECQLLAEQAATPEDRARLLQMADAWRDLAARLGRIGNIAGDPTKT